MEFYSIKASLLKRIEDLTYFECCILFVVTTSETITSTDIARFMKEYSFPSVEKLELILDIPFGTALKSPKGSESLTNKCQHSVKKLLKDGFLSLVTREEIKSRTSKPLKPGRCNFLQLSKKGRSLINDVGSAYNLREDFEKALSGFVEDKVQQLDREKNDWLKQIN